MLKLKLHNLVQEKSVAVVLEFVVSFFWVGTSQACWPINVIDVRSRKDVDG